ncbi:hypothetical protein E2C01_052869 [Portunus trituberculatus]|uniref:Uncharacterized protein n=1 Tax=Portunus trituberculatus TaxID=210409 RepID=A0A5B7GMM3_PORTR|nr:hypothetical protein [Portunus trituberculatus]
MTCRSGGSVPSPLPPSLPPSLPPCLLASCCTTRPLNLLGRPVLPGNTGQGFVRPSYLYHRSQHISKGSTLRNSVRRKTDEALVTLDSKGESLLKLKRRESFEVPRCPVFVQY